MLNPIRFNPLRFNPTYPVKSFCLVRSFHSVKSLYSIKSLDTMKSRHSIKSFQTQKNYFGCPPDSVMVQWRIDSLKTKYNTTELDYCKIGSLIYKLSNNMELNENDKKDLEYIKTIPLKYESVINKKLELPYELIGCSDYKRAIPHELKLIDIELETLAAKDILLQLEKGQSVDKIIVDNLLINYKKHRDDDIKSQIELYESRIEEHTEIIKRCEEQLIQLKTKDICDRNATK